MQQLFIKPMLSQNTGPSQFVLSVSPNESIDNLRQKISSRTNIAPCCMYLKIHESNRILQSGSRLNQYSTLKQNGTIEVHYNHRDWYNKEMLNMQSSVFAINNDMNQLKQQQTKIMQLTKHLKDKIITAPSLEQLNECKIEDNNDLNMAELQSLVQHFERIIHNGSVKRNIDVSMETLSVKIKNVIASIQHNEKVQCGKIDQEMRRTEEQIKHLKGVMVQLETEKAKIQSKNLQHYNQLRQFENEHINNNKERMNEMVRDINIKQIIHNLKESKMQRFKQLEAMNHEWSTDILIIWIRNIEQGYFNGVEHEMFFNNLRLQGIKGKDLQELSSNVCLNLLGLRKEKDQSLLIQHINNLLRMNMDSLIVKGNRCCTCLSKCIEVVLTPCGHQPYCYQCAQQAIKHDNRCPICRQRIQHVIKSFIAGV